MVGRPTIPKKWNSFVFTSSKYDAAGNISNQYTLRNRPLLTQEQLRQHGAGAINSSTLGIVLLGFTPIRSASTNTVQVTTTLLLPPTGVRADYEWNKSLDSSSSLNGDSLGTTKRPFLTPRMSSDSSTGSATTL